MLNRKRAGLSGVGAESMSEHNGKEQIREHYDVMSPYYQELWGEHIHHGYWIRGDESKEEAQVQLIERLAQAAGIRRGCKILDVGCGLGGSSIYLAKGFQADVTGITISPVQVEMAKRAAVEQNVDARFLLMDAEALDFEWCFDVVWSVEAISHLQDVAGFFASAARFLRAGGIMAITDWFRDANPRGAEDQKFIAPIEESMMVKLCTMMEYREWMGASGLRVVHSEVLNQQCARTWDLCLDIIKDKKLWELAARHGPEFLTFLKGFRAMRAAFASGTFVYGMLVAQKL